MIQLNAEDVIRGLKRLKSLAKQDILVSSRAPDPDLWLKTATARKQKYEALITLVEEYGVRGACEIALEQYAGLPVIDNGNAKPEEKGEQQALEIFFKALGVDGRSLRNVRSRRVEVEVGGAQ